MMTFSSIFDVFKGAESFDMVKDHDSSICRITEMPFYIEPLFEDVETKKDAAIIIISAPGAMGKSTLANCLAYKYSALYWNLAKIQLGDNSFIGTLVRSVGPAYYSDYIGKLANGETVLIIDAFDEAEMISGIKAVRNFLREIAEGIRGASKPCIVLLSRAETAASICSYYKELDVPYSHYSISFFAKEQSIDFITKTAEKESHKDQNPEIVKQCAVRYYENARRLIQEEEEVKSFLGYAPVLEVIGKDIGVEPNAYRFLQSLNNSDVKGTEVVIRILDNLLEREQTKVTESFFSRIGDKYDTRSIPKESIYSKVEQLQCILSYVLFSQYDPNMNLVETIPNEIKDEYHEVLKTFLPQHPFVHHSAKDRSALFAGPAFRDYTLSVLMDIPQSKEMLQLFFEEKRISNHFPSHLLWNFYTYNDEKIIPTRYLSYLFEAYRSEVKPNEQAFLSVEIDESGEGSAEWFTMTEDQDVSRENYELFVDDRTINLENLNHVFIEAEHHDVEIKSPNGNVFVFHSQVDCKKLTIIAERVTIDSSEKCPCSLVSNENADIKTPSGGSPDYLINGENVSIDFPNIDQFYKLYNFKEDRKQYEDISIDRFAYLLRRILIHFRKHRKDTPARIIDKIDFVVVGQDKERVEVFEYLIESGIIYREEPMYKVNMNKLQDHEIFWGAVTIGKTEQLQRAFMNYTEWNEKKKNN